MTPLQRILIVDDGARETDAALSAALAELGYASVTASLEATDEVLALIPTPKAIVLQVPRGADAASKARFLHLADRLRADRGQGGAPVIVADAATLAAPGGFARLLEAQVGSGALAGPER
jgi:CheY-like chemotaxis protein